MADEGKQRDPTGVVKLFIGPDGRVIAHAANFERQAPGGFSLHEAQEIRCRRELAYAVLNAFASPVIAAAMESYDVEKMVEKMARSQGYRIHTIHLGEEKF